MKKRLLEELRSVCGQDQIVRLYRKPRLVRGDGYEFGFVLAVSDLFVLLHVVDYDTLSLNGYRVIKVSDIKSWANDQHRSLRAIRLKGMLPTLPSSEIVLTDMAALLSSASAAYPLIMIESERIEPDFGFVGCVERVTRKSVFLKKIDPDAEWIDTEKFRLENITRVSFGRGYTEGLAMVDADNKKQAET